MSEENVIVIPEQHVGKGYIPEGGFADQGAMFTHMSTMHEASQAPIEVPSEHKEKGWAQNRKFKNTGELFKEISELQELKGKKIVSFDYNGKTDNEVEAHRSTTRPENIDAYNWGEVKEGEAPAISEDDKKFYGDMLLKSGTSIYEGNAMIKAFTEKQAGIKTEMFSKDGQERILETSFKDTGDWKKTSGEVSTSLKANLSPEDQKMLEHVPNEFLGMIYRLQNNTIKAYGIKEGEERGGGGGNALTGEAVETKRKDLRIKIGELRGKNGSHAEVLKLDNELAATYKPELDPRLKK